MVVRIATGELRIGLRGGLLEAAIADAFGRPQAAVSRARMLTGDVGRTAVLALEDRLADATLDPLRPIGCMLASPAEDAAEIVRRLGPTVWVEDKYDGVRAQLHRLGGEVRLFSRDLNDVTGQFPEIADAAAALDWDGILDGEVVGFADGSVLPFLRLQARLGRKAPSPAVLASVPVVYVAFDVLAAGPRGGRIEPLLDHPLAERRDRLVALGLPDVRDGGRFALSRLVSVDSVDGLEAEFAAARARRNEGLMVKDPASPYSPGRRGLGWLKMKKALATIDCVVVGVEVGHGKRHGVLSDWTFAVRDEANDRLVTIGKAYTGLTDAELAEMTAWFEAHTISTHGRYRAVEPTIVVEIAFDVIQRSPRHRSGFALRFPRIARLRRDKAAADADTLATVEALFSGLQAGAEHLVAGGMTPTVRARPGRGAPAARATGRPPLTTTAPGRAAGSVCCPHVGDSWMLGHAQGPSEPMRLTLVTEASVIRGTAVTWRRRMTDLLNEGDHPFILLEDVEMEDIAGSGPTVRASHAQVNLDAVLFVLSPHPTHPSPDFHVHKSPERAYVSLPPYVIVGQVHLHMGEGLRDGLDMLVGRFIPVTDAVYWSDAHRVARTSVEMLALNRLRAQILLPFEESPAGDPAPAPGLTPTRRPPPSLRRRGGPAAPPTPPSRRRARSRRPGP